MTWGPHHGAAALRPCCRENHCEGQGSREETGGDTRYQLISTKTAALRVELMINDQWIFISLPDVYIYIINYIYIYIYEAMSL